VPLYVFDARLAASRSTLARRAYAGRHECPQLGASGRSRAVGRGQRVVVVGMIEVGAAGGGGG